MDTVYADPTSEAAWPDDQLVLLEEMQAQLMVHPVYDAVEPQTLSRFMEHHAFAVLDFMWLLKSLQISLTNTAVAWIPGCDPGPRRLVNEIVLGEESDQLGRRTLSHFELYVEAMREAGAETGPILRCVDLIRAGSSVPTALQSCGGPEAAVRFSLATWQLASRAGLAARVGAFAFGREEIIPRMFNRLLDDEEAGEAAGTVDAAGAALRSFPTFRLYLERHVEVDGDLHGPMSRDLVRRTCGRDRRRWSAARVGATTSLRYRGRLWDGVVAAMAVSGR